MHIGAILFPALLLSASAKMVPVEDFEAAGAVDQWVFSNGPEFPGALGDFAVVPEAAHSGAAGGRLRFDFNGGGAYVQATVTLPAEPNLRWINLWVRKTVPNRMTFRCVDSQGETFQKGFNYRNPEWQRIRVDLRSWSFHWGEGANGILDEPPVSFGILVEKAEGLDTGEIFFDDLSGEGGGAVKYQTPRYTYPLPQLSEPGPWRLRVDGPSDAVRWEGNQLMVDFPRGVKSVAFNTEASLLGRPRELRFALGSPEADLSATFVFHSHFQVFEREFTIPQWDSGGGGPAPVAIPLGAMEGWKHYGGEDDGVVRLPLRLASVRLEVPGCARPATIAIGSLNVETLAEAGDEVLFYGRGSMASKDRADFRLFARSLLLDDLELSIPYRVYSYDGRILRRGKMPYVLRGRGALSEGALKVRVGDEIFAEAEFAVSLPGRQELLVSANATRPLPPIRSPESDPTSIFGMGLYLYRYPPTEDGYNQMNAAAAMGAAAGVKWSREEFAWSRIEPERGKYSWHFYDRMVETATRNGIQVYGLLCYWSPWTKPFTEGGIADYCRFVAATVDRYRDHIRHWEVWNEPNIFFWSGPKEVYSQLLREAYRTIKATDPEAQVLGCSTAGIDMAFVRKVISEDGPFDILTIHPYRGDLDDAGFIRELRATHEEVSSLLGRETPVWITEMGWPTNVGALSEREAASRLARVYLCSAASGAVGNVSWYDFRNDAEDPLYNEANFGVVYRDLTPKPAYRALATICRSLDDLHVTRQLDWGDGILAYLFEGEGRRALAVWSVAGDRWLSLGAGAASQIQARNTMGGPAGMIRLGDTISLWLMEKSPVILEIAEIPEPATGPLEVTGRPEVVRGGETVVLSCKVNRHDARGVRVRWHYPSGWEATERRQETGTAADIAWELHLRVPAEAPRGRRQVAFSVESRGGRVDGWISLRIVPETLTI